MKSFYENVVSIFLGVALYTPAFIYGKEVFADGEQTFFEWVVMGALFLMPMVVYGYLHKHLKDDD